MEMKLALPEDTVIGTWKIGSELGRGGQGVVWSAKPTTTRRSPRRALKACFSTDATDQRRFVREIELLRRCENAANVLRVVDADASWSERVAGVPAFAYYVSELCDGSLEERKRKLGDAGTRLSLFREACESVRFLHELENPLIHRDIKPANFLLALEPRRLVLADFGIARPLETNEELTQFQEVVGTQHFRAPEATAGLSPSLRSDIYSLGRVLEWLLTGEVSTDLGTRPVPRGDKLSDDACVALDAVIVKACQPVAANRFASVQELQQALPELWLSPKPRVDAVVPGPIVLSDKAAFVTARDIARSDDKAAWREAEIGIKRSFGEAMRRWRAAHDKPPFGADQASFVALGDSLFSEVMPRLTFALAGLLSQKSPYSDQRRTIEQVIAISDWNWGGFEIPAAAPYAVGFLFHYLHGALCCELERFDLALQMAKMEIKTHEDRHSSPLWKTAELVGWPTTLGGNFSHAAASLRGAFDRFDMVRDLFSDEADYQIALVSYVVLLQLVEAASEAEAVVRMSRDQIVQGLMVDVPPLYVGITSERIAAGARRVVGNRSLVDSIAAAAGISRSALVAAWPNWKAILLRTIGRFAYRELPLGDLPV